MTERLSVGLRLPQYGASWSELRDTAVRAERLGFPALWLNDHFQTPGRDAKQGAFEAMTALSALAVSTTTAGLGVSVMSASYRRASVAARMATVIDTVSDGRLTLGLGAGSDRREHRAYGIPFGSGAERNEGLLATLDVLQGMFARPQGATVDGQIDDAPNLPPPAQPGGPPIWIAAHRRRLLRLAGERAQGIVAAFLPPDQLAARLASAEESREAAGRPDPLRCCLYCYAMPLLSGEETGRFLAREAELLGTTPDALVRWLRTVGVVGSPAELRDQLAAYADAGATDVVLVPPNGVPPDFVDALAEASLPGPVPAPAASGPPSVSVTDAAAHHNLAHLLVVRQCEAGRGTEVAAVDDTGQWTFDELAESAASAAWAYAERGVRRGERVAVVLSDGRPWLASFLGAAWLGAVPVPLDPGLDAERLALVLADADPSLVVADDDAQDDWPSMRPEALAGHRARPLATVHPDDLGYLIYSSGSTGRPKGAMHAHRDMRTSLSTFVPFALGLGPGDRTLSVPRLFTSLGFGNGFFRALGSGAACALSATTPTARSVLDIVERHGVTVLTGVPTFWSQLARFLDRRGGAERLSSVRLAFSSGDSLPAAVAEHLRQAAGLELIEGLGCSECSNVIISQRAGEPGPPGTLGKPVPGVEIRLADADGQPVEPGEPGRLWVRSDSNTSGYWRRAELTRDLVHGEWIRMGDVLSEQNGVFRHLGRVDDLFKVDARWVSPTEVEASLAGHPEVQESIVIGRRGEHGLMRVAAVVVPAGGAARQGLAERLRAHVAHEIAPHSAPQRIEFADALPRLPSGKLDRRSLVARD